MGLHWSLSGNREKVAFSASIYFKKKKKDCNISASCILQSLFNCNSCQQGVLHPTIHKILHKRNHSRTHYITSALHVCVAPWNESEAERLLPFICASLQEQSCLTHPYGGGDFFEWGNKGLIVRCTVSPHYDKSSRATPQRGRFGSQSERFQSLAG